LEAPARRGWPDAYEWDTAYSPAPASLGEIRVKIGPHDDRPNTKSRGSPKNHTRKTTGEKVRSGLFKPVPN